MENSDILQLSEFEELYLINRSGLIIPINDSIEAPVYVNNKDKEYVIIKDLNGNKRKLLVNTLIKNTFRIRPILKKDKHVEGNSIIVTSPNGSYIVFSNILKASQSLNIELSKIEHALKFKNLRIDNLIFKSVPIPPSVDYSSVNPDDFKAF